MFERKSSIDRLPVVDKEITNLTYNSNVTIFNSTQSALVAVMTTGTVTNTNKSAKQTLRIMVNSTLQVGTVMQVYACLGELA